MQSSASSSFDMPGVRTLFSRRAFSIVDHAAWNELPMTHRTVDVNADFNRLSHKSRWQCSTRFILFYSLPVLEAVNPFLSSIFALANVVNLVGP